MKFKFKCRPAEECCWDDPYYTKEIEVDDFIIPDSRLAASAAEEFAHQHCNRRSEYGDMEVQVLLADGWHTFDVIVWSVPEFVASKVKVPPAPDTFFCDGCEKRHPVDEKPDHPLGYCVECVANTADEEDEE